MTCAVPWVGTIRSVLRHHQGDSGGQTPRVPRSVLDPGTRRHTRG